MAAAWLVNLSVDLWALRGARIRAARGRSAVQLDSSFGKRKVLDDDDDEDDFQNCFTVSCALTFSGLLTFQTTSSTPAEEEP